MTQRKLSEKYVSTIIANWASNFSFSDISSAVQDEAMRCIVDTFGVSLAGIDHPTAHLSRRLASDVYGKGPCSVLGDTLTLSAPGAAFCNGVAAHVLDYDDVSYEGMVHASAVVLPAVLAAGQRVNASGEEVLTAFVVAVEAEYALGRAMTHDLFWRGWWTTSLLGSIGAAIGAAKVMNLDSLQMSEAISIAACQTTGPYVVVGTPTKPYACGRAAEVGVQTVLAVQKGLQGPPQSFEHDSGFIAMYGDKQFVPEELDKLGQRFVLETSRIAFKQYPVCAAGQSSPEALQKIMSEHGLNREDVERVDCEVTSDVAHYMSIQQASNVTEAQFCLPFCLACILRFGELTAQQLSMEVVTDQTIAREVSKINIIYSKELDQLCDQHDYCQLSARLTVKTTAGKTITEFIAAPTGIPGAPMSTVQLDEKFIDCASKQYPGNKAAELLEKIKSLPELANIDDLF